MELAQLQQVVVCSPYSKVSSGWLYVASVARTGENGDSVNLQGHLVMTGIDICTDIHDDMECMQSKKGLKYNECLLEIILKVISTV